jgi:probable F420-dependent oxidoreductase
MRAGFILPQLGPAAGPEAVVTVAQRAEALGFASLWVTERLLWPLAPQSPFPATPDGALPEVYQRALDPLETLTFVAAHTRRIALGTSVLNMPYYNPVVLARRLTTLDVLSGGRLRVGLGLGWSKDEYDATGASFTKGRGRRADEFLQVLKAIWTTDPVEFEGEFFRIPRSIIGIKPVQQPHPPIYLGQWIPAGLQRAARYADGWHPIAGLPPMQEIPRMMGELKRLAQAAGRDPAAMAVILRAHVTITPQPLGEGRGAFTGSLDEITRDVETVRAWGIDELAFDPTYSPDGQTVDGFLRSMELMRPLV